MIKILRSMTARVGGVLDSMDSRRRQRRIAVKLNRWRKEVAGDTSRRRRRCQCANCRQARQVHSA